MQVERIIGRYDGETKGPMLIFTAAIHGNETPGVRALQEVFRTLENTRPSISGSIVGIAGNLKALEQEVRYIDEDLNRIWLSPESDPEISEFKERDEISETLNRILSSQPEEVYFFDLHSTSANTTPFIMLSDTLRNRELGRMVGVPMMLGLLEHLQGTLMDITSRSGFPTLLFQGGGMKDENTATHHMGLIWKALSVKCRLNPSEVPEAKTKVEKLNSFAPTDPKSEFFEIVYSRKLDPGDKCQMRSGYTNFQSIKKREVLGTVDGVDIKAPASGQIFMPLYQEQGSEAYFIVKPIASFWMRFSRGFRLFKYHKRLNWLAGVKKINRDPLIFRLHTFVTFIFAVQIFHLLGYIKVKEDGPILYMTRREDERNPPTAKEATKQFTEKAYLRSELKQVESDWRIPFSGDN